MCRDGHVQIGHSDSENEMCPLCVALARAEAAETERDTAKSESDLACEWVKQKNEQLQAATTLLSTMAGALEKLGVWGTDCMRKGQDQYADDTLPVYPAEITAALAAFKAWEGKDDE